MSSQAYFQILILKTSPTAGEQRFQWISKNTTEEGKNVLAFFLGSATEWPVGATLGWNGVWNRMLQNIN